MPIYHGREQLSEGSSEESIEFDYDEEEEVHDDESEILENQTGTRWDFREGTWKNPNFMFDPMPRPISGLGKGPKFLYNTLSTFLTLFELFWSIVILNAIVNETNKYATVVDPLGRTKGAQDWEQLIVGGFEGFYDIGIVYRNEKATKL